MADKNYTYAVARIRAMETVLFSSSVIEQLMAVKTWSGCLDFLREKGWGSGNLNEGAEELLEAEEAKAQKTVRDLLGGDDRILSVFSYQYIHTVTQTAQLLCRVGSILVFRFKVKI